MIAFKLVNGWVAGQSTRLGDIGCTSFFIFGILASTCSVLIDRLPISHISKKHFCEEYTRVAHVCKEYMDVSVNGSVLSLTSPVRLSSPRSCEGGMRSFQIFCLVKLSGASPVKFLFFTRSQGSLAVRSCWKNPGDVFYSRHFFVPTETVRCFPLWTLFLKAPRGP